MRFTLEKHLAQLEHVDGSIVTRQIGQERGLVFWILEHLIWKVEKCVLLLLVRFVVVLVRVEDAILLLDLPNLQIEGNLAPEVEGSLENIGGAAKTLLDAGGTVFVGVVVAAVSAAVVR